MVLTDISSTIRSLSDEQFEKLNLFVAGVELGLRHSTTAATSVAPASDALPVTVTESGAGSAAESATPKTSGGQPRA